MEDRHASYEDGEGERRQAAPGAAHLGGRWSDEGPRRPPTERAAEGRRREPFLFLRKYFLVPFSENIFGVEGWDLESGAILPIPTRPNFSQSGAMSVASL